MGVYSPQKDHLACASFDRFVWWAVAVRTWACPSVLLVRQHSNIVRIVTCLLVFVIFAARSSWRSAAETRLLVTLRMSVVTQADV